MRRAIFIFAVALFSAHQAEAGSVALCGLMDRLCTLSGSNVRDQRITFINLCDPADVAEARKREGVPVSFDFDNPPPYCANIGRQGYQKRLNEQRDGTVLTILGVTLRMSGSLIRVDDCSWRTADQFGFYYIGKYPDTDAITLLPVSDIDARGPALPADTAKAMLAATYAAQAKRPARSADACTRRDPPDRQVDAIWEK